MIGRQQGSPAVGFESAGPFASGGLLQVEEDDGAQGRCQGRGAHRPEAQRAAEEQNDGTDTVPQPAIAAARGAQRPQPDPAGGGPAVDVPHQLVVPARDEIQHGSRERHTVTIAVTSAMRPVTLLIERESTFRAVHRRAKTARVAGSSRKSWRAHRICEL